MISNSIILSEGKLTIQRVNQIQTLPQHMAILCQSFPFGQNVLLFVQQVIKLLLNVQIVNKYLFATVPCVIDQESNNGFGDGVVDVLFYYIEV